MPKVQHDLVDKLKKGGMPEKKAWPVATAALQKSGRMPKKKKTKKTRGKKGDRKFPPGP